MLIVGKVDDVSEGVGVGAGVGVWFGDDFAVGNNDEEVGVMGVGCGVV